VTYLAGYRYLPSRIERNMLESAAMSASDWKIVAALGAVMLIAIFQSIAYYQLANVLPIWLQQHAELNAAGFAIPIPWFSSIDPLASMVSVPFLFALWRREADRSGSEPSDLGKIGMGAWVCALANLVLVGAIASSAGKVLWIWPLLYCVLQGVGFIYYWPTLLALVSRCAPPKINATMMGICFLVLFIANNLIGWIGTYYAQMTPLAFWLMHAGIAAAGGICILLLGPLLKRVLERRETQPLRPAAMIGEVER
jgi:POT family proton-dependent oligopeptide transporter